MKTFIATFSRTNDTAVVKSIEAEDYFSAKEIALRMGEEAPFGGMHLFSLTYRVKVVVKVMEEFGKHCLAEIRGLKEGTELEGVFNPVNSAFDFFWKGEPAMLWVGCNAEIIEE